MLCMNFKKDISLKSAIVCQLVHRLSMKQRFLEQNILVPKIVITQKDIAGKITIKYVGTSILYSTSIFGT